MDALLSVFHAPQPTYARVDAIGRDAAPPVATRPAVARHVTALNVDDGVTDMPRPRAVAACLQGGAARVRRAAARTGAALAGLLVGFPSGGMLGLAVGAFGAFPLTVLTGDDWIGPAARVGVAVGGTAGALVGAWCAVRATDARLAPRAPVAGAA